MYMQSYLEEQILECLEVDNTKYCMNLAAWQGRVDATCVKVWAVRIILESTFRSSYTSQKLSYCISVPNSVTIPLIRYFRQVLIHVSISLLTNCI